MRERRTEKRTAKVRILPFLLLLGALAALGRSSSAASPADPQAGLPPMSVEVSTFRQEAAVAYGLDTSAPEETVKLVFVHHSCGSNWLSDWSGGLGEALGENNYYVSDTSYGWGPADADVGSGTVGDHTDIGHWYNWFAGPHRDTYVEALYATVSQYADYTRAMADPGGENEIIMFKSCYPNSDLGGTVDDPPTSGENPLRGQGSWSAVHTVGNAKGIYNDILAYFETRQDKLFVVITAPPLLAASTSEAGAANARALNDWLVHEWLAGYPHHNVAVFDFYNVLTTNGGDADTNDYGLATGNHHRVITSTVPMQVQHKTDGDDDVAPNYLEYPTGGGTNNHPSAAGNQKATDEFVPLLNAYYNCWKHGHCWGGVDPSITLVAEPEVAYTCVGGTAAYSLSVTASQVLSDPVTLALEGAPGWMDPGFTPNPVSPPGNSRLDLTTLPTGEAGTYPLEVVGSAGEIQGSVPITLAVAVCPFKAFLPITMR